MTKSKNISRKISRNISKKNKFKTTTQSTLKQSTLKQSIIDKQKRLRIITIDSPGLLNDAETYKNEFIKKNYKVDIKIIHLSHHDIFNKYNIIEKYYDVNLFLETLPFKCKMYFPSKYNLFMPNNELFIDTKINNKNVKQIYIKNNTGFGNKVFDLIFAIYLYNLYNGNCTINYVLVKSQYEKEKDPTLDNIFPNASNKIKFITERQYQNINYNREIKINKIYNDNPRLINLESFPKYDELSKHTNIDNNFRLVYKMYETFVKDDKDIFINMNTSLINKIDREKITKYTNLLSTNINTQSLNTQKPYSIIHIRYGDKFYSLIKDIKTPKFDYFLLYTPQYYIDMINMLVKQNIPVIIITDSISLVKEFIMPSFYRNPKVNLLDIHWIAGFYLLCHAKNIVMSCNTFSMCSSYFNKNAKCHIVIYHESNKDKDKDKDKDKHKSTMPEEDAIAPNWEISKERKYILNYNEKLFLSMIE